MMNVVVYGFLYYIHFSLFYILNISHTVHKLYKLYITLYTAMYTIILYCTTEYFSTLYFDIVCCLIILYIAAYSNTIMKIIS